MTSVWLRSGMFTDTSSGTIKPSQFTFFNVKNSFLVIQVQRIALKSDLGIYKKNPITANRKRNRDCRVPVRT